MRQDSVSELDDADSEPEFIEVEPSGRYGRYKEVLGKGALKKVISMRKITKSTVLGKRPVLTPVFDGRTDEPNAMKHRPSQRRSPSSTPFDDITNVEKVTAQCSPTTQNTGIPNLRCDASYAFLSESESNGIHCIYSQFGGNSDRDTKHTPYTEKENCIHTSNVSGNRMFATPSATSIVPDVADDPNSINHRPSQRRSPSFTPFADITNVEKVTSQCSPTTQNTGIPNLRYDTSYAFLSESESNGVHCIYSQFGGNSDRDTNCTPYTEKENCIHTSNVSGKRMFATPSATSIVPDVAGLSHTRIDVPAMNKNITYSDLGDPEYSCAHCNAKFWFAERVEKQYRPKKPTYSGCCMKGKIKLPDLDETPTLLKRLLSGDDPRSSHFRTHIRSYKSMFSFTSMGGKLDRSINNGSSPPMFRLHGENYHFIGSLLPEEGCAPKFAQLYIHDTKTETQNRIHSVRGDGAPNGLLPDLVNELKDMIDKHNVLAKSFRMMKEVSEQSGCSDFSLRLISKRGTDPRRYNKPSASEVAALIVGTTDESFHRRDVIVKKKSGYLQRISELHPSYIGLQYPLLFPYGEDGYREDIPLTDASNSSNNESRKSISVREFLAYRLHDRNSIPLLLSAGRLTQQFMVDGYTMIESGRTTYHRLHQDKIRCDFYNNLSDALLRGENDPVKSGKRIILPSSFTGGSRYMIQNYQDAMAICQSIGYPNLFITFTCNPKWPEITRLLEKSNAKASDRPDAIARVFKMKLNEMITDFKQNRIFGTVKAVIYTIEFQKRGLPHAHILLFLNHDEYFASPEAIDTIITAEIPDAKVDPVYYDLVAEFMMHGPCGISNLKNPCMSDGCCTKHFPKKFVPSTHVNDDGFPVYMRRDNGRFIEKNGIPLDNRYVVPHSAYLLKKYRAHINVEACNRTSTVKYLFKYVHKGEDRATIAFYESARCDGTTVERDEVKMYYDCRYVSSCEAMWRIYSFDIQYRTPSVERLGFHLPEQQQVFFSDSEPLESVVDRATVRQSQFLAWFEANKQFEEARLLTYQEFPKKFVWNQSNRTWQPRKRGFAIGRLSFIRPGSGEVYYLRCLLNIARGPLSYDDLKSVNGVQYSTFREACHALGLLDDDSEYISAFKEASNWGSGRSLRILFVTLLTSNCMSMPYKVWEASWRYLSDDILHNRRVALKNPGLIMMDEDIQNTALIDIQVLLNRLCRSLVEFPDMPFPSGAATENIGNRMILDELCYDRNALEIQYNEFLSLCTPEQRKIHDEVLRASDSNKGGFLFVYGYGGSGKTFLWNGLSAGLRCKGDIVVNVASSGIASLLLPGGRTAHSRFRIPLNPVEGSTCNISQGTELAELLIRTKLIIWDEAPMVHRHCFEALDRSLRDIMESKVPGNSSLLFGGKTVVLGGDFRQILPVVPQGSRQDIVNATVNSSYLWRHCIVLRLTKNMRLRNVSCTVERKQLAMFAKWIADVGDGLVGGVNHGEADIEIPRDLLIHQSGEPIVDIVDAIYPSFNANFDDPAYLHDRAILASTLKVVHSINDYVLSLNTHSSCRTYFSSDKASNSDSSSSLFSEIHTAEFLNTLNCSGLPTHELKLKVGTPVMLLRNIDHANGLCNGTRLIITRLGDHILEAKVISGGKFGAKILLPRMTMTSSDKRLPFVLESKQFPIIVCYAMTINKSQGQSLNHVGLFLQKPVFTHGQLYVAFSRVTNRGGLRILLPASVSGHETNCTRNVVYKEVIQNI